MTIDFWFLFWSHLAAFFIGVGVALFAVNKLWRLANTSIRTGRRSR